MAVPLLEPVAEGTSDRHPLLMDQQVNTNRSLENHDRQEHVIDISRGSTAMSSIPHGHDHDSSHELHHDNLPIRNAQTPIVEPLPSVAAVNSRNTTFTRRGDTYNRRHRSPLNSGLWISIELVVNMSQIIAAIIVLSLSKDEKPQTPLFEWIIGYTAGCAATLPHLYWRYIHRNNNHGIDLESAQPPSGTSNTPAETTFTIAQVTQAPISENQHGVAPDSELSGGQTTNPRLSSLVEHFKMALDCFFAVWFVVGNVWIFGGHSSVSTAPNLYRLCIVFLTFSCIGYAMPFILCATICCCLPCIISILGFREDLGQNRGASTEIINSLPVYKFKMRKTRNSENNPEGSGEGGIIASGTDKERSISGEDASCCICLSKYASNEELRELPCSHFFHKECVDKWLKINALCPLCKFEVSEITQATSSNQVPHGQ